MRSRAASTSMPAAAGVRIAQDTARRMTDAWRASGAVEACHVTGPAHLAPPPEQSSPHTAMDGLSRR
jgi:hypothetical protein